MQIIFIFISCNSGCVPTTHAQCVNAYFYFHFVHIKLSYSITRNVTFFGCKVDKVSLPETRCSAEEQNWYFWERLGIILMYKEWYKYEQQTAHKIHTEAAVVDVWTQNTSMVGQMFLLDRCLVGQMFGNVEVKYRNLSKKKSEHWVLWCEDELHGDPRDVPHGWLDVAPHSSSLP